LDGQRYPIRTASSHKKPLKFSLLRMKHSDTLGYLSPNREVFQKVHRTMHCLPVGIFTTG
ncbi:MAG: hypothetical protein COB00_07740, partial [Alcanivorax sp.]